MSPRQTALAAAVLLASLGLVTTAPAAAEAEDLFCVDTVWKMVGPNHKVCTSVVEDPRVEGVACHLSRARTGGVSGAFGLAEDPSNAALACRQVGPVRFKTPLPSKPEEVFNERRSILFKELHVVRYFDRPRNTLVYLVYSDKLIEGSPKNSISTVPLMPWGTQEPIIE